MPDMQLIIASGDIARGNVFPSAPVDKQLFLHVPFRAIFMWVASEAAWRQISTGTFSGGHAPSPVTDLREYRADITMEYRWTGSAWQQIDMMPIQPLPSIATAAGAGSGGSLAISLAAGSNDHAGRILLTTGNAPAANGQLLTLTYNSPYTSVPRAVMIEPASAVTNNLARNQDCYVDAVTAVNASVFFILAGSVALAANTSYSWWYRVDAT